MSINRDNTNNLELYEPLKVLAILPMLISKSVANDFMLWVWDYLFYGSFLSLWFSYNDG